MDVDFLFLKKTPPHSLEAERAVLGGVLINNASLNSVLSIISSEDFYKDAHRKIFDKIVSLIDKGMPVDLITLTEELRRSGLIEEVGGAAYISSLLDGVHRQINVEYYARIIKEKALLRRLIFSSAKIISAGFEEKEDADELLNEAQAEIIEVAEQRVKPGFIHVSQLTKPVLEMVARRIEQKGAVTGVPTGFRDLDNLTSGFHPSEFVVIAARPSMGKTALCLNISQHVGLKTEYSVGFFSMEMTKEQIMLRLLCAESQLDLKRVRDGYISEREFERFRLAAETFSQAKIYIDESPALTVTELKAKSRRLRMEQKLDLLFIDYIQLLRTGGKFENRNQEMAFISRSLKELAKEIHIPVVGISQLSRAPEKARKEPRPQLSDLRESGAIEQDADVVIFIYRPEVYRRHDESVKGIAEINVAKQRNGPTDIIRLVFLERFTRFVDAELGHPGYVSD